MYYTIELVRCPYCRRQFLPQRLLIHYDTSPKCRLEHKIQRGFYRPLIGIPAFHYRTLFRHRLGIVWKLCKVADFAQRKLKNGIISSPA